MIYLLQDSTGCPFQSFLPFISSGKKGFPFPSGLKFNLFFLTNLSTQYRSENQTTTHKSSLIVG